MRAGRMKPDTCSPFELYICLDPTMDRQECGAHRTRFCLQVSMDVVPEIIRTIHWSLIVFILGAPLFAGEVDLTLHAVVVPFLMLHWATNQSVCALTEMEKYLRGKTDDDETFFGQVVGPVYKFRTKGLENIMLWGLLVTLWIVTLVQLQRSGFRHLRADFARFYSSS